MDNCIKALSYQKKSVGKRLKSSKKLHIWTFLVRNKLNTVELYSSKFSGKQTLKINGEIRMSGKGKIKDEVLICEGVSCKMSYSKSHKDLIIQGDSFERLKKDSEIVRIVVTGDNSNWEMKARPFGKVVNFNGARERFPVRKRTGLESKGHNLSVLVAKPRSSSERERE